MILEIQRGRLEENPWSWEKKGSQGWRDCGQTSIESPQPNPSRKQTNKHSHPPKALDNLSQPHCSRRETDQPRSQDRIEARAVNHRKVKKRRCFGLSFRAQRRSSKYEDVE